MTKIMFAKIAWSENSWNGWDPKGYDNREGYGYGYVKENGFGLEWWNFFDFGDEYFYGHIEFMGRRPTKFESPGLIAFLSKNIYDGNLYFVGFYGQAELSDKGFKAPKSRWDTLPEEVQSKIDDVKKDLQNNSYLVKAEKKYSTVFRKKVMVDEASDLGTGPFRQASFVYGGENEKISPERIYRLFERALKEHENLLNVSRNEQEEMEIKSIMRKIEGVIKDYNLYGRRDSNFNRLFERLERILDSKKQVIIYGPPGTGKTFVSRKFVELKSSGFNEFSRFVTFHQSYSYEEFIEGLKPVSKDGQISYSVEEGIFKKMCRDAFNALCVRAGVGKTWAQNEGLPDLSDEEKKRIKDILEGDDFPRFYLVVDEINRGDISRIFGELITLLEADKRLMGENELIVILPNSKTSFAVPPNLYIIGTMNTADRSIALIDVALRRRFGFIELMPDYELLEKQLLGEDITDEVRKIRELAINVLKRMNEKIGEIYDRDHQIGHSYFIQLKDAETEEEAKGLLKEIWFYEIIPLLQEYFYDSPEKLVEVLGEGFFDSHTERCYKIKDISISDEDFVTALEAISSRTGEESG
jgi:MoxR-like ATPase